MNGPETQLDLYDESRVSKREAARRAANVGIESSSNHSGPEWKAYAIEFVRKLLLANRTMHVDDLWEAGLKVPESLHGVDAVVKHALREGWIERIPVDGYPEAYVGRPSVRSNKQLKPVWRSVIFENLETREG